MPVEQVPNVCPKCGAKAGQDGWRMLEREKRGSKIINVLTRPTKPRKIDETWKCDNCKFEGTYRTR